MAHGLNTILKRGTNAMGCKSDGKTGIGSRRIFAPQFKLQVLDSYRNDADCKGNQRATARKYGIHRRQIQKWLQVENNLRNSVVKSKCSDLIVSPEARKCGLEMALRSAEHRQRDDVCVEAYTRQQRCSETAGDATERRGEETLDAADKRVPDIPQHQHQEHRHSSPVAVYATTITTLASSTLQNRHHEWQPMHPLRHGSPDDTSSTRSSHSYSHSHSEVEFYGGIGSPSHCSLSPRSPPFVPIPLHPYPVVGAAAAAVSAATAVTAVTATLPLHIPTPGPVAVVSPTPFCSSNMSPLPLDFTTHTRRVAPSPDSPRGATTTSPAPLSPVVQRPPYEQQSDSAAPIDLSLKKPYPRAASPDLQTQTLQQQAPVPVEATVQAPPRITSPNTNSITILEHHSHTHTHTHSTTQTQIWDLSTKGIKREHHDHQDDIIHITPPSVPISESHSVTLAATNNRPIKLFKPYLDHVIEECPNNTTTDIKPVIVSSIDANAMPYIDEHCYSNNNNNVADIKMEYPSYYKDENYHQGNFYSPVNADYYPNGGLHFMDSRLSYEDARYRAIKQRQSYSLDFKLSAIECYYSDAICRGNQRAVASKFKIHRRQVQKWLKQEDQLRQRNDTKPMHIVR